MFDVVLGYQIRQEVDGLEIKSEHTEDLKDYTNDVNLATQNELLGC